MFKNRLRRYAGLLALITALVVSVIFVVIANNYLDTKILQRDYFSATKTANYAQLLPRIGPQDEELRTQIQQHVGVIRDGGQLVSPYGPSWFKPATTNPQIIAAIEEMDKALAKDDFDAFAEAYISFSKISAQADFEALEELEIARYVAVAIIVLGFFGVLVLLFFRLGRADDRAMQLASENNHILATVDHGLFLIDNDFNIGQQKSHAVRKIFGESNELSGSFLTFLSDYISDEDLVIVKEYVELLFGGRVKQKLMSGLNPLNEVPIHIESDSGSKVQKYLNIGFARDEASEENNGVLVTIDDVTQEVTLRQELELTKELQEERMGMLMGVLHVNPSELKSFFEQTDRVTHEVNEILADESVDHADNIEKLDHIYRIIHRLNGDAAALNLTLFESTAHRFEDAIERVKQESFIDGRQMLELTVQLKEMIAEVDLVRNLTPQINALASAKGLDKSELENVGSAEQSISQRLRELAQRVAERQQKTVEIDCSGFDLLDSDPDLQGSLYDIAVQLVRNSIVHGIEEPAERVNSGKKSQGLINVLLNKKDNQAIELIVRDDGIGMQFERIRQKAIEKNLLSDSESDELTSDQLLKYIFMPGFSSAETETEDTGRGVGLDLVKHQIKELAGKVGIRTAERKYCQFTVTIPQANS